MPWMETSVMDERIKFIGRLLSFPHPFVIPVAEPVPADCKQGAGIHPPLSPSPLVGEGRDEGWFKILLSLRAKRGNLILLSYHPLSPSPLTGEGGGEGEI